MLEAATSAFTVEWRVAHLLQPLRLACSPPTPDPNPNPHPNPDPNPNPNLTLA